MKKLGIKLLTASAIFACFALTSCKSNGYGCDYGAIENEEKTENIEQKNQELIAEENFIFVKYSKE